MTLVFATGDLAAGDFAAGLVTVVFAAGALVVFSVAVLAAALAGFTGDLAVAILPAGLLVAEDFAAGPLAALLFALPGPKAFLKFSVYFSFAPTRVIVIRYSSNMIPVDLKIACEATLLRYVLATV